MTRWIQTAEDGEITAVVDEEPDDGEWIEITELAYMSDAAQTGWSQRAIINQQPTNPTTAGISNPKPSAKNSTSSRRLTTH